PAVGRLHGDLTERVVVLLVELRPGDVDARVGAVRLGRLRGDVVQVVHVLAAAGAARLGRGRDRGGGVGGLGRLVGRGRLGHLGLVRLGGGLRGVGRGVRRVGGRRLLRRRLVRRGGRLGGRVVAGLGRRARLRRAG